MSKLLSRAIASLKSISNTHSYDRLAKSLKLIDANVGGRLKYEFIVDESHVNINNTLHGGYIAYLVDHTTTAALCSCREDDKRGVSIDMNVSYLRSAALNDVITIETDCKKNGATLAFLEVTLKGNGGELIATGRHTKFVGDVQK